VELPEGMKLTALVVALVTVSSVTAFAAPPKLVPIPPVPYVTGDHMTSDEVLAIATEEYALLEKYVAKYGEQPGTAQLRAAADAHFAEGVKRLGEEVKAVLDPEAEQEAFRRGVEELGKEVAAILKNGNVETPEEAFRREVAALAAEVTAILSNGGAIPSGDQGMNGGRHAPTSGGTPTAPAASTETGRAAGAGWAGALGRD